MVVQFGMAGAQRAQPFNQHRAESRRGEVSLGKRQGLAVKNLPAHVHKAEEPPRPVKGEQPAGVPVDAQIALLAPGRGAALVRFNDQPRLQQLANDLRDRSAADAHSLPYIRTGDGFVVHDIVQHNVAVQLCGVRMRKEIILQGISPIQNLLSKQTGHSLPNGALKHRLYTLDYTCPSRHCQYISGENRHKIYCINFVLTCLHSNNPCNFQFIRLKIAHFVYFSVDLPAFMLYY